MALDSMNKHVELTGDSPAHATDHFGRASPQLMRKTSDAVSLRPTASLRRLARVPPLCESIALHNAPVLLRRSGAVSLWRCGLCASAVAYSFKHP
eukprot:scaffold3920_cov262-Pinguiococcus_pyrenoidosus.AAC.7